MNQHIISSLLNFPQSRCRLSCQVRRVCLPPYVPLPIRHPLLPPTVQRPLLYHAWFLGPGTSRALGRIPRTFSRPLRPPGFLIPSINQGYPLPTSLRKAVSSHHMSARGLDEWMTIIKSS